MDDNKAKGINEILRAAYEPVIKSQLEYANIWNNYYLMTKVQDRLDELDNLLKRRFMRKSTRSTLVQARQLLRAYEETYPRRNFDGTIKIKQP